ncbi:ABC transporter ATP-binding protein [Aureimonas leprariae]|uniref:ABC transporter ATP-binding protein n=1 Tax=Plantimonas leprariae TaxID=2615207 RepID=UPI001FE5CAAF|nr:ABC transporter ATP-binding protein [Aureimonas leprariae]
MTETRPSAVRIAGLRRGFDGRAVLDGIDLEIGQGEFVALLGRSGSGKSTILRAVAGLDADVEGRIDVPERRSVLFQDSRLLPWMRVLDNVILGLAGTGIRDKARHALSEVGLADKADAWPKTLSGGEQQRVALARSLARDPELLLADEPFSALDALTRLKMHGLLQQLRRRHAPAVLFVTHDVEEALRLADRIAITANGRISFDHPVGNARSSPERLDALRREILDRLGVPSH